MNPEDNPNPTGNGSPVTNGELLLDEYKLLQDKIDKLGEDKFKVRSWCITLATGVIAGAKLAGGLSPSILLLVFPIVAAFHLVEHRQRQIAARFGMRAREIELQWRQQLRDAKKEAALAPKLAIRSIIEAKYDRRYATFRNWIMTKLRRKDRQEGVENKCPPFSDCLVAQADFHFYAAQYFVVMAIFFFVSIHHFAKPPELSKTSGAVMTFELGTNELHFGMASTNVTLTNFLTETRYATNLVVVTAYKTNLVVIDVIKTNSLPSSKDTNSTKAAK